MKTSTLLLCAAMLALGVVQTKAQMSEYDYNQPVGWATVDGGVTGSNDENPVEVSTLSDLRRELTGSTAKTIYINGTIEFDGILEIDGVSNKTIYGLKEARLVNNNVPEIYTEEENEKKAGEAKDPDETGILIFKRCNNIIIRNLTFESAGAYDVEGNDNLCFQDCQRIWVDHCDFQDGMDGNLDCNHTSDYIAVTWCCFHYQKPAIAGGKETDDHRFSNLWGGGDNQTDSHGHLNTTFYACWWGEGCRERMPRVRFGKVHILNCLYSTTVANYCISAGYLSNLYVERNAFVGDFNRIWRTNVSSSYPDYHITLTGNIGTEDHKEGAGSDDYFIPSDYYTLEGMPVDLVETEVSTYAGATLNVEYGEGVTTGISNIGVSDADVVSTEYFSPSGTRLNAPQRGLNIVRQKMSDGTVRTRKTIVK